MEDLGGVAIELVEDRTGHTDAYLLVRMRRVVIDRETRTSSE